MSNPNSNLNVNVNVIRSPLQSPLFVSSPKSTNEETKIDILDLDEKVEIKICPNAPKKANPTTHHTNINDSVCKRLF